jgi:ATP-dependent protease ClpP protease subunit
MKQKNITYQYRTNSSSKKLFRNRNKDQDEKKRTRKKQKDEKHRRDESDEENDKFLDEDEMDAFGSEVIIDGNHIYFNSDVTKQSIFDLCQALNSVSLDNIITATQFNIDPIPIYLHINSNGGSVFAAFTAIDNIMNCKVPVYTIIEGASASAATIMSVVGKRRFIRANSYMLIHELRSGCWGRMSEMEDEMENNKKVMKRIKKIYKEHTTIPHEEMKEILKHDMWWDAEKCLEMGLVDGLWN